MSKLIGRNSEIKRMKLLTSSQNAQFWAIFGRRRIGKTYLIRNFFTNRDCVFCEVTGQKGKNLARQLAHFQASIEKSFFEQERLPQFKNWDEAFEALSTGLRIASNKKPEQELVVFLDELPWLATRRSGLLDALDHFWNTKNQHFPNLRLIICGSAASWMIDKVIFSKGGLHNRLTATFRLSPFTLSETKDFLKQIKFCPLDESQILQLYMCMGGVPYYLSFVRSDYTASQNIGSLFFGGGELSDEYERLFAPLFENSETHDRIVRTLCNSPQGLIREEIVEKAKIPAGRTATVALKELEEAGFLEKFLPMDRKTREIIFRVTDEFCIFHFKWIRNTNPGQKARSGIDYWQLQSQTQAFASWSGLAFERVCYKHVPQIAEKLGVRSLFSKFGPWSTRRKEKQNKFIPNDPGAQIDLLFVRSDHVTTIVEIKYRPDSFEISKKDRADLESKINCYRTVTKSKDYINLAIVSPHGVKETEASRGLVSGVVELEDLFKEV